MIPIRLAILALLALIAIQFLPYGHDHANPPVSGAPAWDSPRTETLARRACFDCHSHETRWPWYAAIAPFSWRIQHHVDEGREKVNFSLSGHAGEEADECAASVREGKMPPWDYALAHPEARLTAAEKLELAQGLARTFGEGEAAGREGAGDRARTADARESGEGREARDHDGDDD